MSQQELMGMMWWNPGSSEGNGKILTDFKRAKVSYSRPLLPPEGKSAAQ